MSHLPGVLVVYKWDIFLSSWNLFELFSNFISHSEMLIFQLRTQFNEMFMKSCVSYLNIL
jgi:hypothetical protein